MFYYAQAGFKAALVPQGRFQGDPGAAAPPVKFLPPLWPQKKFKIRPPLAKTESLLCISCHFNVFTLCDILTIYITY